ncbi:MAG: antA/AntB antirepressor family protein [Cyclobacteriaceae bacterium]
MSVTKTKSVKLPIITQGDQILVDAKILHQQLESSTRFRDWITYRIKEYNFENQSDYYAEKVRISQFGKRATVYHLTLDMAKELAMLERNEIGRKIRRYFIAQEKKARGIISLPPHKEAFRGISTRKINDRTMLPYQEVLRACGYSTRSSSSGRKARYWMHFVKEGAILWITEDFARHLYHQKQVIANRTNLQNMQAVLPMNFGDTSLLNHA